ncbi:polysaccharide biosynthesis/export family protein [Thalassomonas haliotis]|uniref:Polysaccharide export protein n=1 Tax=Thalassomonas haliotis TaxID=485448 RepID=A0ABY7VKY7_9GAMM|nr:polysaccharide export protein [Thalassomonas haliotis]
MLTRAAGLGLLLSTGFADASARDDYLLAPGDKIEITVFGQKDLSMAALLGKSGKISYPFLGEVIVAGLSITQLENTILKGLKQGYLINPSVYAQVVEYRPFYIHGEVEKPGAYPFHPGLTVNQAVALAGGFTERASHEKIQLLKEGKQSRPAVVPLTYSVSAGDTITVQQRFF